MLAKQPISARIEAGAPGLSRRQSLTLLAGAPALGLAGTAVAATPPVATKARIVIAGAGAAGLAAAARLSVALDGDPNRAHQCFK